jgi:hypothetical protein
MSLIPFNFERKKKGTREGTRKVTLLLYCSIVESHECWHYQPASDTQIKVVRIFCDIIFGILMWRYDLESNGNGLIGDY